LTTTRRAGGHRDADEELWPAPQHLGDHAGLANPGRA
jgi:hypothetical protein